MTTEQTLQRRRKFYDKLMAQNKERNIRMANASISHLHRACILLDFPCVGPFAKRGDNPRGYYKNLLCALATDEEICDALKATE